ncbi:hypothetical protein CYG48_13165 [Neorhizobium sp. SOG26]|jgi:hypothetical protein|uniref:Uncharacterized protein n=1 Tax=Pseudorhizobium endolithicum TaxID=1191678 RepID=A0ABM8PL54_9HYPH|nr:MULTISPECIES: DUF6428 family protein [Rhizobium/Agrobacterium group]AXV16554.1 hypothetical protein CYG48_13165 [Neorhizobium sp. SOG26]CAD7035868.1 hypothetical protein REJC140_03462 [Pseudorhizobium endolithicum]
MDTSGKSISHTGDITLGRLLELTAANHDLPLVFSYEGRAIKSGYHVTEVKAGHFSALDCGANPEAWAEIFVQLWDVDERDRTHMTAGKFSAIVRKVSQHVRLPAEAKLTFEVSDGMRPMQLFCADEPSTSEGVLAVTLVPRAASCKPRDRWLAERSAEEVQCRGHSVSNACCE